MNVSELKKKLEILERNNLGDIEVYCSCGYDPRGNEDVQTVSVVEIDCHLPVIILCGESMEDESICMMNKKLICTEKCPNAGDCDAYDCEPFLCLLRVDGREEITDDWENKV